MKIGIVVHSITGNTQSVAERIQQQLVQQGHVVNIERIRPTGKEPVQSEASVVLTSMPDLSAYDALVFGSPVQAFALDPVMSAYLKKVADLGHRKTVCFITQMMAFRFFVGNRSIKHMKTLCEARNGAVSLTGIINWSNKQRAQMIDDLVSQVAKQFSPTA